MSYQEKINIYLPEGTGALLDEDAMRFEILKKDRETINRNRFLSRVLMGYYRTYAEECRTQYEAAVKVLAGYLPRKNQQEAAANSLLLALRGLAGAPRRDEHSKKYSLKPTTDTEGILQEIRENLPLQDSLSGYLCQLLFSYSQKPLHERERIVFQEECDLLEDAAKKKQCVSFSTSWNPDRTHTVLPYGVFVGQDEMYNYLLCMEQDRWTGMDQAVTYRLNRLQGLRKSAVRMVLTASVRKDLDEMARRGAQYVIRGTQKSVIGLTPKGQDAYLRVYQGRPKPDTIEEGDGIRWFVFSCSEEQLFFYFRKFEGGTLRVREPDSLRKRLLAFHEGAVRDLQESTHKFISDS
ncbi:MAG: WYL domain-containing protein [Lachnospiraceae bacterium]